MTALAPPPAAPEQPLVEPDGVLVRVGANLMPEEVLAGRRLARLKVRIAMALGALIVLLAAGYGWSWWQTSKAEDDLSAEQARTFTLTQEQASFGPLVATQARTSQIQSELQTAMATDLPWNTVLTAIYKAQPHGVSVSTVTGTIDATSAAGVPTAAGSVLNQSGLDTIGSLTLSGTAPDKSTLAAFVDALSRDKQFVAVYPSSVTGQNGAYTYTVGALLTSDALGGRFSATTTTTTTVPGSH